VKRGTRRFAARAPRWAALLAVAALASAQAQHAPARVGVVFPDDAPAGGAAAHGSAPTRASLARPAPRLDAMYRELLAGTLRELGWTEGRNLTLEVRYAGVDPERQRKAAAALKALPVAAIVVPGSPTIRAVHEGAPGVPIVMVYAGDPIGSGFIATLARPGGDLTGTSAAGEEVLAKQLELLAAAVPRLQRVGVLMNSANSANDFFFRAMSSRARELGLRLERIEVAGPAELETAVARARGGGLIVLGDPMFAQQRSRIVETIRRAGIPAIFGRREFVTDGGLMSYVSSNDWHWRRAARFVDKILRGARPADLPVEQPTVFELTINMKTARALGLAIPQQLLLRADEVIE
jgi:ABC-type uncharacterized transport system substrate-binding protein